MRHAQVDELSSSIGLLSSSVDTLTGTIDTLTGSVGSGMTSGTLSDDTAHGDRGNGTLHTVAVAGGNAGFMSAADKEKLDNVALTASGDLSGSYISPSVTALTELSGTSYMLGAWNDGDSLFVTGTEISGVVHIGNTDNPHNVTAEQLEAVTISGTQTIVGTKTLQNVILGDTLIELDGFSGLSIQRNTSGKTQLLINSSGAFDADLKLTRNGSNQVEIGAKGVTAQHNYTNINTVYFNTANNDVDHIFRGTVDDNLLRTDAGLNSVGVGVASVDASAKLEVASTSSGFLPPRMTTTERTTISTPADGLVVYDTDIDALHLYADGSWAQLGTGGGGTYWQASVLGLITASVGGESIGDRYIVISGATGDLAGQENNLAIATASSPTGWNFETPLSGQTVYDESNKLLYTYDPSASSNLGEWRAHHVNKKFSWNGSNWHNDGAVSHQEGEFDGVQFNNNQFPNGISAPVPLEPGDRFVKDIYFWWHPETSTDGDVEWQLVLNFYAVGDTPSSPSSTTTVSGAVSVTTASFEQFFWTPVLLDYPIPSGTQMITWRATRDARVANANDTFAGNVGVYACEMDIS